MKQKRIKTRNTYPDFAVFAFKAHEKYNKLYGGDLPYWFHLRMVKQVAEDFFYLLPQKFYEVVVWDHYAQEREDNTSDVIFAACYGHDLIEDGCSSYSEILSKSDKDVAEICFACTDVRGRNRKERHGGDYFDVLKSTPGAVFVKLCDRIANIQHSCRTKNWGKIDMYKSEHEELKNQIYTEDLKPMWDYMESCFTNIENGIYS